MQNDTQGLQYSNQRRIRLWLIAPWIVGYSAMVAEGTHNGRSQTLEIPLVSATLIMVPPG